MPKGKVKPTPTPTFPTRPGQPTPTPTFPTRPPTWKVFK